MKLVSAFSVAGLLAMSTAMVTSASTTRIETEITVVDSEGKPIEGAEVQLGLPRYGQGRKDLMVRGMTDNVGKVRLAGEAEQSYDIEAHCDGYYPHTEPSRPIATEKSFERYAKGLQRLRIELRPIVNPVVGLGRRFEGIRIPEVGQEMGFDAVVGDFVPPLGKGKVADFTFVLRGRFDAMTDYDQTFEIRTMRPKDGILPFSKLPEYGSAFLYDYAAPQEGYEPSKIWRRQRKDNTATDDIVATAAYYFRIRSELDEQGNVKRALYGIIARDIQFGHKFKPNEFFFTFSYILNTDWNRNMEFDIAKSFERASNN